MVVLIHGGYWRSIYTKALMNGLARAVIEKGWAAWNIEYRRLGPIGGGGGWPGSFDDIRAAIDHVALLPLVDPDMVITCGHSVGGTFALWAARSQAPTESVDDNRPKARPRAVVSLAGITNLERADALGLGNGAVTRFLGGSPRTHPERYAACSPAGLLPLGIPQVLVHGVTDAVVPPSMSSDYREAACQAGDEASYVPIDGIGHRDLIDPRSQAWPVISANLERLFSV